MQFCHAVMPSLKDLSSLESIQPSMGTPVSISHTPQALLRMPGVRIARWCLVWPSLSLPIYAWHLARV